MDEWLRKLLEGLLAAIEDCERGTVPTGATLRLMKQLIRDALEKYRAGQ